MTAKAKSSSKRKAETLQSDEGIAKFRKIDHRRWKRKEDYCSLCKSITGTHGGAVTEFHPAWDVLLPKLPFRGQLKMAQTCQKFKKKTNKDSKFRLKLYRKRLFINKNLARSYDNPKSWAFFRALVWLTEEQSSINTRSRGRACEMSPVGILAKAESLGRRISKYGFGRDMGCPYFWSPWVSEIYSPDWSIKINPRAPWRSTVGELATGKKKFENWQFLPKRWNHEVSPPQICQNFVLLQFYRNMDDRPGADHEFSDEDFLVLNMATKRPQWIKTRELSFLIR